MRKYGIWFGLALIMAVAVVVQRAEAVRLPHGMTNPGSQGTTWETTPATGNVASLGSFGPLDLIYGFDVFVEADGGSCGLYDVATLEAAAVTQGILFAEGGGGLDGETYQSDWPGPYELVTDLTVVCENATLFVYHQPII